MSNQTLATWEAIVIDDGGTCTSEQVVSQFGRGHARNRITYHRQANAGPASARNTGCAFARNDVIVYLDSDDTLLPSALDDIAWVLREPAAVFGLTNHNRTLRLVDDNGRELARRFDHSGLNFDVTSADLYDWRIKTTSSGLFHRRVLPSSHLHWRSGFWIEDLEFLLQMAVTYPHGFRHIPKVLVDYNQTYGADGLCSNASYADWANAFASIYALHHDDPLMRNPRVYLDRVARYEALHARALTGSIPSPVYKYFPEYYRPLPHRQI